MGRSPVFQPWTGGTKFLVIGTTLAISVFLLDQALPVGVAGGAPYIALVLLSLSSPRPRHIIGIAGVGILLTILAAVRHPSGDTLLLAADAMFVIAAISCITVVSLQRKRTEKSLWDARRKLQSKFDRRNEEFQETNAKLSKETSERIDAQSSLRDREDQLRQAQKLEAVGKLAGGVAHDFNNHLTAILGFAEMISDELEKDPKVQDLLTELRNAADRSSALTRQLLALSRKQDLIPRIVNLNHVAHNIEKMLRRIMGEDFELSIRTARNLASVKVDVGQIEQVILNLVINARDAMRNGGRVTIETSNQNSMMHRDDASKSIAGRSAVCLAVRDSGVGMDPSTQARIFDPYFTTKREGEGTGLGLSTVYGIVKQSGGEILVESELDVGSTFFVLLPAAESGDIPKGDSLMSHSGARGDETILVVEDDESVRRLACLGLQRDGYRVLAASGSREALDLLQREALSIDLLVADLVMGEMNGRQLYEQLNAEYDCTGVLFITGYADEALTQRGAGPGDYPILRKPFSRETLSLVVRKTLDAADQSVRATAI